MKFSMFALIVIIYGPVPATAQANDFDGWCFELNVGCGVISRIEENSFGMCEASCEMLSPQKIDGLNATLYEVFCKSDNGDTSVPTLFIKYQSNGEEKALYVDDYGPEEMTRC